MAGAIGTAVGPALGGALTELFDWRAIFFVQAPVVALAVVAAAPRSVPVRVASPTPTSLGATAATRTCGGRCRPSRRSATRTSRARPGAGAGGASRGWRIAVANAGFALVFAALVAALFLGVLLAIEVWRYSPLGGAALVSALPLGMALGRLGHAAPSPWRAGGGCLLLALGLTGLAVLPGRALGVRRCGVRHVRRRLRPRPRGARRGRRAGSRLAGAQQRGVGQRPPRRSGARAGDHRPAAVDQHRRRHPAGDARGDAHDARSGPRPAGQDPGDVAPARRDRVGAARPGARPRCSVREGRSEGRQRPRPRPRPVARSCCRCNDPLLPPGFHRRGTDRPGRADPGHDRRPHPAQGASQAGRGDRDRHRRGRRVRPDRRLVRRRRGRRR